MKIIKKNLYIYIYLDIHDIHSYLYNQTVTATDLFKIPYIQQDIFNIS